MCLWENFYYRPLYNTYICIHFQHGFIPHSHAHTLAPLPINIIIATYLCNMNICWWALSAQRLPIICPKFVVIDQHWVDFGASTSASASGCDCDCDCLYVFMCSCFCFSFRKKNRTNDAIRMFKRCIEIDATYVQAHLELFRLHGERRGALILTDAIKANPDNLDLRLAFGHWLLNNGKCRRVKFCIFNYFITLFVQYSFVTVHP